MQPTLCLQDEMSALGELEQVVYREGEVEASDREQAGFPILDRA